MRQCRAGRVLNVLHAYKVYAPEVVGGIPEVIRQLAMGLSASCRAEILVSRTSGFGSVETGEGAPIRRTPSLGSLASMPIAPSYPFHLWGSARRADLVAYHAPFPLVDLTVSTHFPSDTALVVHWHSEIVAQRRLLPLVAPLIRRTLRRADRIIVSSPAMIERSPFLGPFAEKCAVIPYGIDLDQWTALTPSQQVHVEQLRALHPRLVVAAGRLVRYKGYDVSDRGDASRRRRTDDRRCRTSRSRLAPAGGRRRSFGARAFLQGSFHFPT